MARSLQELQERYNSAAKKQLAATANARQARGGKGSGPKNAGKTIKRILTYMHGYVPLFIVVLFCMLVSTVASLFGSYLMAPVINKLTEAVTGKMPEGAARRITVFSPKGSSSKPKSAKSSPKASRRSISSAARWSVMGASSCWAGTGCAFCRMRSKFMRS